jgi:2-polyprenyl-3-methyl-5-hydroxy-6-metoxy-1,4-benzoquinol methylase
MTDDLIDPTSAPRVGRLQTLFRERHRMSRALVGRAISAFGSSWVTDFERTLHALCPDDAMLESAAKGYSAFAFDSMRRQKAFETSLDYPHKSYAEAANEVYFNERHMLDEYLPGLLLSHFLWPHHYRQLQFFDLAFVTPMRLREDTRFAEIGVGTALYSCRLLEQLPSASGAGYDISPSSCAFAQRHVNAIGAAERYRMNQQDILVQAIEPVQGLVCVEVLEHLEDPVTFLKALRRGLAPGGRAFITAALNAAHADHIYLYRNAEEVSNHLTQAGFALEQCFVGAAYAPPATGVPVPLAAAFVVF